MHTETSKKSTPPTLRNGRTALLTGGMTALLASTCCVGLLVLISLGFSGAWIGNLKALEPYRPAFIGVALAALFLAWRRIWRPTLICAPGKVCAVPKIERSYKYLFAVVSVLILIALTFPYIAPWFY